MTDASPGSNCPKTARLMAGVPQKNSALLWRVRFLAGDPVALVELSEPGGAVLIIRDIEMDRARKTARADRVTCPADFTPEGGLSGDRETATAQATAECLRREGIQRVVADRTLPLIFAELVRQAGIEVICDLDMGVGPRRAKDEQEIGWLREAQAVTEGAMEMACRQIARADVRDDGVLVEKGEVLTAEIVRAAIDHWLLDQGYANVPAIVAGGPEGADCHNLGSGPLRTGQPVIVDIFPRNQQTQYCGDCTRTVVHGDVPDEIARMHAAVVEAKAAGIAAVRTGVTGQAVHEATIEVIRRHGYDVGLPKDDSPDTYCAMVHGTGHGVGLDVHEPPLLDMGGPKLVRGDAITVEPGLYCKALGGIRVEDMVIVTDDGHLNLNRLPEGLDWR
ncbi:MAG: aminopeptidase P family protein [Pirellulales bacterium]|nr:aminopeptidase P family protein [Pirellulales bacterium]